MIRFLTAVVIASIGIPALAEENAIEARYRRAFLESLQSLSLSAYRCRDSHPELVSLIIGSTAYHLGREYADVFANFLNKTVPSEAKLPQSVCEIRLRAVWARVGEAEADFVATQQ